MRMVYLAAALAVTFLLGAFVEHAVSMPFGLMTRTSHVPLPAAPAAPVATGNTDVPHLSNVRGQQDAPRSDTPRGAATDFERCVTTMKLRREPEAEARTVCRKIITGISD